MRTRGLGRPMEDGEAAAQLSIAGPTAGGSAFYPAAALPVSNPSSDDEHVLYRDLREDGRAKSGCAAQQPRHKKSSRRGGDRGDARERLPNPFFTTGVHISQHEGQPVQYRCPRHVSSLAAAGLPSALTQSSALSSAPCTAPALPHGARRRSHARSPHEPCRSPERAQRSVAAICTRLGETTKTTRMLESGPHCLIWQAAQSHRRRSTRLTDPMANIPTRRQRVAGSSREAASPPSTRPSRRAPSCAPRPSKRCATASSRLSLPRTAVLGVEGTKEPEDAWLISKEPDTPVEPRGAQVHKQKELPMSHTAATEPWMTAVACAAPPLLTWHDVA